MMPAELTPNEASSPTCPKCGAAVLASVAHGLCPRCLARSLFSDDDRENASSECSDSEVTPLAGTRIGPYVLLECLARGGMGVIYRVKQTTLNRELAMKILPNTATAGIESLTRFRAEASALAALHHPNIVAIHEVHEEDGQCFFSMDLVDGGSLVNLVRAGPLLPVRAAELMEKIANAIAHAHDRGVLHRDLKPSNVLLDAAGEPRVTDFGLAKRLGVNGIEPTPELTLCGQILGTPAYLAPEQIDVHPSAIGRAADVYGLGALLYYLLTCRPPFLGETLAKVLRQVEESDPILPRLLNPLVPRDLETICLKAMAKEPSRRYAGAEAFRDDLQRFQEGKPIAARPASAVEKACLWCRRKPAMALLAASSLVLLAVTITTISMAASRLSHQGRVVRWNAYVADMRLTERALEEGNIGLANALLDRWIPGAREEDGIHGDSNEDLRGFEWRCFHHAARGDEVLSIGPLPPQARLAFSSDGRRLLGGGQDGRVRLWNAADRRVIAVGKHPTSVKAVAFAPSGGLVATGSEDGVIHFWHEVDLAPLATLSDHSRIVALRFSDDGAVLVSVNGDGITHWDAHDFTEMTHQHMDPKPWFYGGISENGEWFALPQPLPLGMTLWHAGGEKKAPLERVTTFATLAGAESFSSDHRFLASGQFDGQVQLLSVPDFKEISAFAAHDSPVASIAWSPDGARLATGGRDQAVKLWHLPEGRLTRVFRGHLKPVTDITFSPDGGMLVSSSVDGTVKWWKVAENGLATEDPSVDLLPGLHLPQTLGEAAVARPEVIVFTDFESPGVQRRPQIQPPLISVIPGWQAGIMGIDQEGRLRKLANSQSKAPLDAEKVPKEMDAFEIASPDGHWIVGRSASGTDGDLLLWRVGEVEARRLSPNDLPACLPAFAPDSQAIAIAMLSGEIVLFDPQRHELRSRFPAHTAVINYLAFSPDGQWLGSASSDGAIKLWSLKDLHPNAEPRILSAGVPEFWSIAFSPDGQRVAAGADGGRVFLWDFSSGNLVARLRRPGQKQVFELSFTASGNVLVTYDFDSVYRWLAPFDFGRVAVRK